jgi:hypothetical protein
VPDSDLASSRVLAEGETFVIRGAGRIVWCKVNVPRGLDPARGAASGAELGDFLLGHVLERHSSWLGVVFDVRDGPSVIGPISLQVMQNICERAELVRRRLAILVGPAPMVKEQLTALVRVHAPRFGSVTDERRAAVDWMTSPG